MTQDVDNDTQSLVKPPPRRLSLLQGVMASVADNKPYLYRGGLVSSGFGFMVGAFYDMQILHSSHGPYVIGAVGAVALIIISCALAGVVVLLQGGVKTVNSNVAYMAHKVIRGDGPEVDESLIGALSTPIEPDQRGRLSAASQGGDVELSFRAPEGDEANGSKGTP